MKSINLNNIILLLAIMLTFINISNALPENTKCEKICQNVNRGCTNNCTKSGGSKVVCESLCSDRYEGCFYKCLYNNNCSK
jgi:hypothetical protein